MRAKMISTTKRKSTHEYSLISKTTRGDGGGGGGDECRSENKTVTLNSAFAALSIWQPEETTRASGYMFSSIKLTEDTSRSGSGSVMVWLRHSAPSLQRFGSSFLREHTRQNQRQCLGLSVSPFQKSVLVVLQHITAVPVVRSCCRLYAACQVWYFAKARITVPVQIRLQILIPLACPPFLLEPA